MARFSQDPFADDFGPDIVDRRSGKFMGGNNSSSNADPSYQEALQIVTQSDEYINSSEVTENAIKEATDLARKLTSLCKVAGVWIGDNRGGSRLKSENPLVCKAVQDFIAALQSNPPDVPALKALCLTISEAGDDIKIALERVCGHENIQLILAGNTRSK